MGKVSWPITDRLYLVATPLIRETEKNSEKVRGILLDVGGPNEKLYELLKDRISKYYVLNIKRIKCSYADKVFTSDATKLPLADNSVDTVLCTQLLEHVAQPQKVVDEIHRVLKPNCYCLLSTNMAWIYHPDPKDYYRFTSDGLKYLFRKYKKVEVNALGGYLMALCTLRLLALSKIPLLGKVIVIIMNVIMPPLDRIFYSDKLTNNLMVVARK